VAIGIYCRGRLYRGPKGIIALPYDQDFLRIAVCRDVAIEAEVRCNTALERALLYPIVGAITGAWLGSVVFPLDWERPWQVRHRHIACSG